MSAERRGPKSTFPRKEPGEEGSHSYLQRVNKSLRANPEIAYVGFCKLVNPVNNIGNAQEWPLEIVNIDIAPTVPIYDAQNLQMFMEGLFDFDSDSSVLFEQRPKHMKLGRLIFKDVLGKWTRTTNVQFKALDHSFYGSLESDPQRANYIEERIKTQTVEEIDLRVILVNLLPDESLAYIVAACRQGENIGFSSRNVDQARNYLTQLTEKGQLSSNLLELIKNNQFTVFPGGSSGAQALSGRKE